MFFSPKAGVVGLACLALLWALGGAGLAGSAHQSAAQGQTLNPSPPAAPVRQHSCRVAVGHHATVTFRMRCKLRRVFCIRVMSS